ncbi:TIGR02452 family protein [Collinsella sp. zg1085]|uniref:TIGR02452 family protein n=1 Tax=Collinsella sp. zg1085 TaxID=2844380 RepID=UPI001C0B6ECB|nr:TIGR02452 family protein [Collinsella sp. zg1085]QWT17228.1 TIGR02452 family protein [Collinsella sp. zg1085]
MPNTARNHSSQQGRSSGRREHRMREATKHIAAVQERFASEITSSIADTKFFDGMPVLAVKQAEPSEDSVTCEAAKDQRPLPHVSVLDMDAHSVIVEHGRGRALYCDMTVLDCASFMYPGGGYERGNWGQEQQLCASSYLFQVLQTQKAWYQENRRHNVNCELYRNRALLTPHIRFTEGNMHAYADVLVVAAPHARRAREDYHVDDETLNKTLRSRIRFLLHIAEQQGNDKLVLSAFGCDEAGWDAECVAELFHEELASGLYSFTEVYFAVPRRAYHQHHEAFSHVFSAFPERASQSFAEYCLERERMVSQEQEQQDMQDEDDWRKYL